MLTPDIRMIFLKFLRRFHAQYFVTLAPVLRLDQEAMISTAKQQKPVLGDLAKVSQLASSGAGTHMQVFHSQVQH